MAKCLGALLSNYASGKFGKVMEYRTKGNLQSVRFVYPRKDADTDFQSSTRKVYGLIVADWRIANNTIREEYKERARGKALTNANVFYQDAFKWIYHTVCGEAPCAFGRCG